MSWMDSWSRPGKSQATPPPYYLTHPSTKYCFTCGRIISERRTHKAENTGATPAKYCSTKCRSHKPRTRDHRIEEAFVALLDQQADFQGESIPPEVRVSKGKGDKRLQVPCSTVETLIFGDRADPTKIYGRRKNRASRAIAEHSGSDSDELDYPHWRPEPAYAQNDADPTAFAGKVRPPQHLTSVNGSIGGEKGRAERTTETEDAAKKRIEGQRLAEDKESIKRAARRLCVFGVRSHDETDSERRMCEAVIGTKAVEPSFAKGDWSIRWRE